MLGLLLAFVPAAICAQKTVKHPTPQTVQRTAQRSAANDTVVTSTGDTVVTSRTSSEEKPHVVTDVPVTDLDAVIARAVRLGVQQAMADQGIQSQIYSRPRTKAEALWDRSQKKRKIERVPRESLKATFVPKGQWMVGGTVNYSEWDTDNYNLLVLKNVDIEGHTFSGSPFFGYFVSNNIALGGRYNYTRNYFYLGKLDMNLGNLNIGLDENDENLGGNLNISLEDLYYLGHTHTGDFFVRTYMPIGKSNVFGFFAEVRAGYAHSVSKNSTGSGVDYDGSFTKSHTLQLNVCPGMACFVTDFLAAEASIGIMGVKYRWVDQKTNQVETGRIRNLSRHLNFPQDYLSYTNFPYIILISMQRKAYTAATEIDLGA